MAESIITPDLEALLATYKSRVTPLEIPKTTSPSSLPTAKYKSGSNLLTLRATSESPSPRPLKIIHHEFSDAGIIGRVNNVVHGTHNSRRATLVTFSFSFRTGHHALRFKNASIKVVFEKHPSAESHHRDPAIVKFAPRKIFGLPVKETDHRKYSAEFAGSVPVGPVEVGPKAGVEIEREYEKEYRFKTVGNFWSTKHGSEWDVVYWIVQENKRSEQGIPDLLNVAVIVENEGPFQATVEVRVDTPLLKGLFGFPWSKADPVAFIPDVAVGEWKSTLNFEELTERDWRKLIPYEEEFEDKLTEATALYISRENTPVPPGTYGDSLIVTEGDGDEKPVLVEDQPDEDEDDEDKDNPRKRQKR